MPTTKKPVDLPKLNEPSQKVIEQSSELDEPSTTPAFDSKGKKEEKDPKKMPKEEFADKQLTEYQLGVQKYLKEIQESKSLTNKEKEGFEAFIRKITDPINQGRIKDFILWNPVRQFVDAETVYQTLLDSHDELKSLAEHAKYQPDIYAGYVIMSTVFAIFGAGLVGSVGSIKGTIKGIKELEENYDFYAKSGKGGDKFLGALYATYKLFGGPLAGAIDEASQTVGPKGKESFEQMREALQEYKGAKKRSDEKSGGVDPGGASSAVQGAQDAAARQQPPSKLGK